MMGHVRYSNMVIPFPWGTVTRRIARSINGEGDAVPCQRYQVRPIRLPQKKNSRP